MWHRNGLQMPWGEILFHVSSRDQPSVHITVAKSCSKWLSLESNSTAHMPPSTVRVAVQSYWKLEPLLKSQGICTLSVPTGGHVFPSIALHSSSVPSNLKEIQEGTSPWGIRLSLQIRFLGGVGGGGAPIKILIFFQFIFSSSSHFQVTCLVDCL